jgi:hypothetical protein
MIFLYNCSAALVPVGVFFVGAFLVAAFLVTFGFLVDWESDSSSGLSIGKAMAVRLRFWGAGADVFVTLIVAAEAGLSHPVRLFCFGIEGFDFCWS